ncbi:hypothetical protein V6N13_098186 [Hibiscus sabdariffa]
MEVLTAAKSLPRKRYLGMLVRGIFRLEIKLSKVAVGDTLLSLEGTETDLFMLFSMGLWPVLVMRVL